MIHLAPTLLLARHVKEETLPRREACSPKQENAAYPPFRAVENPPAPLGHIPCALQSEPPQHPQWATGPTASRPPHKSGSSSSGRGICAASCISFWYCANRASSTWTVGGAKAGAATNSCRHVVRRMKLGLWGTLGWGGLYQGLVAD